MEMNPECPDCGAELIIEEKESPSVSFIMRGSWETSFSKREVAVRCSKCPFEGVITYE